MPKKYITFFHNSDSYRKYFTHRDKDRHCFYWFSDSYFNHCGLYKYFCLFVKNPKDDNIEFISRHGDCSFDGLYRNYLEFLNEREEIYKKGKGGYAEPSILASFSRIEPDIIAENNGKTYIIIKPKDYKGEELKLFASRLPRDINDVFPADNRPVKFTEIKEVVDIVPNILNSYPFIKPSQENNKYFYNDWCQIKD